MKFFTQLFKLKEALQRTRPSLRYLALGLGLSVIALTGCNNGGNNNAEESGQLVVSLTDAPGDFVSYTVDVLSLKLTKANGAVVETLPVKTTVDFSQYTDMTEFLTAATIPSGVYTKAVMTLDYSNANIQVEDESGNAVQVNSIKDEDGNDIQTLGVNVQLQDRNSLLIAPGVPAHLSLDFDLNASNQVTFDTGNPVVTVQPFLVADVNAESSKIHRVRGPLKSVDVANNNFKVIIRPFRHILADHSEKFGTLTVTTTSDTIYDIDGVSYTGGEGLTQLSVQPSFTAVVALGDLKFNPLRFEAKEVHAGSSVPGGSLDAVSGNVIKRAGNVLTVKGATLIRAGGSAVFNDSVSIQLGDGTTVHRQLSADSFSIADISVGQRITVFGTLTNETATQLEMDASNGSVRLLLTTVRGKVVTNANDPLVINLQSIDSRRVGLFDFAGTGMTPEQDADPAAYEVGIGTLDTSFLMQESPVKVIGFTRPFGQAPADFQAQTIVDVADINANLAIDWLPATTNPFTDISSEALTLNLEGHGKFHHVSRAGVVVELPSNTMIEADADGKGMFFIEQAGTVQLYTTFADFVQDLQTRLAGNAAVRGIKAHGKYDDQAAIFTANTIKVKIR